MKLQDALWKTIRQFGVSVIQEKRLMPFLADYRAFDDCPAVRDVMNAIATGEYREKLCLAACESNEEWLRFAGSLYLIIFAAGAVCLPAGQAAAAALHRLIGWLPELLRAFPEASIMLPPPT